MDLRRLCCVGLCACGAALVVLMVPSLRFILASQAGLVVGWRMAAMPPNILTPTLLQAKLKPGAEAVLLLLPRALYKLALAGGSQWLLRLVASMLARAKLPSCSALPP